MNDLHYIFLTVITYFFFLSAELSRAIQRWFVIFRCFNYKDNIFFKWHHSERLLTGFLLLGLLVLFWQEDRWDQTSARMILQEDLSAVTLEIWWVWRRVLLAALSPSSQCHGSERIRQQEADGTFCVPFAACRGVLLHLCPCFIPRDVPSAAACLEVHPGLSDADSGEHQFGHNPG